MKWLIAIMLVCELIFLVSMVALLWILCISLGWGFTISTLVVLVWVYLGLVWIFDTAKSWKGFQR